MYLDYSPQPNCPSGGRVLVVQDGDEEQIDEIIQSSPTTIDDGGNKIFWIVFADKPRRVWNFTERALRASLTPKRKGSTTGPVTLHVRTEPYEEKDDHDVVIFDGNKVIGEVKRGDEILHTEEVVVVSTIESVCDVKDEVAIQIELWVVENTDFIPTADALPT